MLFLSDFDSFSFFCQINRMRLRRWKQRTIVWSPAGTPRRQPRPSRPPGRPPRPPAHPPPPRVSPWGYHSITSTSPTPSCQVSSVSALVSAARWCVKCLCKSALAACSFFFLRSWSSQCGSGGGECNRLSKPKIIHLRKVLLANEDRVFNRIYPRNIL